MHVYSSVAKILEEGRGNINIKYKLYYKFFIVFVGFVAFNWWFYL